MNDRSGFSLLETIIAIAVCAIVLAALASVNVSSLRQTRFGGERVQATQVLDTIGRRVVGGQDVSVIPGANETIAFDYGELDEVLALNTEGTTDRFRVSIAHEANMTVGASSVGRYRVEVCYRAGQDELCVQGVTLSRRGT